MTPEETAASESLTESRPIVEAARNNDNSNDVDAVIAAINAWLNKYPV